MRALAGVWLRLRINLGVTSSFLLEPHLLYPGDFLHSSWYQGHSCNEKQIEGPGRLGLGRVGLGWSRAPGAFCS